MGDELADGRGGGRKGDDGEEDGASEDQEGRREGGVKEKGAAGDVEVGRGIEVGSPRSSSSRHWNHWGSASIVASLAAPASPSQSPPAHPHLGAPG